MTRTDLTTWLNSHKCTYTRLAREAGIGHFILLRWLGDPRTGISTRTVEKLQGAMWRLEQESQKVRES